MLKQSDFKAHVLIPDPLAAEIQARYTRDEPKSRQMNLQRLGERVIDWYKLMEDFKEGRNLVVKLYQIYPTLNVSVYDWLVLASPVVFNQRGTEGLTYVFARGSTGAIKYEKLVDDLFTLGEEKGIVQSISPEYLEEMKSSLKIE